MRDMGSFITLKDKTYWMTFVGKLVFLYNNFLNEGPLLELPSKRQISGTYLWLH